jgi:EmrB/QacA subfamily drug resistance transporter
MLLHAPRHGNRRLHLRRPAAADPAAPARLGLVLAATSLAMFVVDLDFFALNLSVPKMASDLGVTTTDMQWVISGYMLAGGAFLIPGGRLGDILGRRRMLLTGLVLFGGASAICGSAPSAGVVIAFRVVQGLGCAILFPVCIAVVTNAFPEERRKRAIGNLYGLAAIATAAGPFVGGALTSVSWRLVFFVNVPIALAAIVLTLRAVPESRDETAPRHIDLRGLATVALGIAAITFAVDRGQVWGWASAATLGTFGAGLVLLAGFVAIERRVRFPLVDLGLFRNLPYVRVTLLGMLGNIAFCVTTFGSTLYLQDVRGFSPILAGLIFLGASATLGVAGPLSGRLGERFDIPALMTVAMIVGAAGLIVVGGGGSLWVYIPALTVFGIGYGLCWSLASVGTQTVVPVNQAGEASGVTLAIVVGVAGLGVAVAAAVIEVIASGDSSLGGAIEDVLRVTAVASAVSAVGLMVLRRRAG